jgi:hypothetical protein
MRTLARLLIAAALAVVPLVAEANDWRVACSTLAVDESAITPAVIYQVSGPELRYSAATASTNPIVARISPVNTSINPELPGWTTLQLHGFDVGAGTIVQATLKRFRNCSGLIETVCTATLTSPNQPCATCAANALGPIDFSQFTYFVEVTVDRGAAAEQPRCNAVRLF